MPHPYVLFPPPSPSTATWTTPAPDGCCSPDPPTSTGSTRCGPSVRRDPRRRGHPARRQPPAAGQLRRAPRRPGRRRAAGVPAEGHRQRQRRPRPRRQLLATGGEKIVYTTDEGAAQGPGAARARRRRGRAWARSSTGGPTHHLHDVRGVRRLMVEGGGRVHTQLLRQGLADELQLVLAPLVRGGTGRAPAVRPRRLPGRPRAGCGWSRPGRSGTSSSCATSPPRPAPGP